MKVLTIKPFVFAGGVNPSSSATFRLNNLKSNLIFLWHRIKTFCHPELFDKANKRRFELWEPVPSVAGAHCFSGKTLRFRNKFGMTKHSSLCQPEFISGARGFFGIGMTSFKEALAFTLAETLIVMGIIGVVAALTIPNLNSSTADKEKVAKLQKIYQNLNDAFGRAEAVYGPIDEWFQSDTTKNAQTTRFAERMSDFMKNTKDCGYNLTPCFAQNYKTLEGTEASWDSGNTRHYTIADGSAVGFVISYPTCDSNVSASNDSPEMNTCGFIYIDLDGAKGSATSGKDHFRFYITKSGVVPMGNPSSNIAKDDAALKANCFKNGNSCAGWVIQTGNMDYLKATNGTCKNGTVLSWTNTSCK